MGFFNDGPAVHAEARRSKYPIFEVSGFTNHTLNAETSKFGYLDSLHIAARVYVCVCVCACGAWFGTALVCFQHFFISMSPHVGMASKMSAITKRLRFTNSFI